MLPVWGSVYEATGDTEKLQLDQIKLRQLRQGYNAFSKEAGLITQNERLNVAGFGKKQAGGVNSAVAKQKAEEQQKAVAKEKEFAYNKQKAEIHELIRREYSLKVNEGRQGKHIRGHNNFDPKRSELTADPQELAKLYAGNGEPLVTKGGWNERERFEHSDYIGIWKDRDGVAIPTKRGIIHYSKEKGLHIVPVKPAEGEQND